MDKKRLLKIARYHQQIKKTSIKVSMNYRFFMHEKVNPMFYIGYHHISIVYSSFTKRILCNILNFKSGFNQYIFIFFLGFKIIFIILQFKFNSIIYYRHNRLIDIFSIKIYHPLILEITYNNIHVC